MRQFRTLPKCIAGIFGEVSHFACNAFRKGKGTRNEARPFP